jgi:hypothetical protein
MTFHDVVVHLKENWHKYGILYLVLRDVKSIVYVWEKVVSFKDMVATWFYALKKWIQMIHF